jgi:hypothetical protein
LRQGLDLLDQLHLRRHSVVFGNIAVATYIADEHEVFHGHQLHCQYRTTDTWRKTREGWRLIGSQVLALCADPPPVTLSEQQIAETKALKRIEDRNSWVLTPAAAKYVKGPRCTGSAVEAK